MVSVDALCCIACVAFFDLLLPCVDFVLSVCTFDVITWLHDLSPFCLLFGGRIACQLERQQPRKRWKMHWEG